MRWIIKNQVFAYLKILKELANKNQYILNPTLKNPLEEKQINKL